jgi:hypothetical protein
MIKVNKVTIRAYQVKPGMIMPIKVVAVVYETSWCAYQGPSNWTDERVAESGDQIPFETAGKLFPVMTWTDLPYKD